MLICLLSSLESGFKEATTFPFCAYLVFTYLEFIETIAGYLGKKSFRVLPAVAVNETIEDSTHWKNTKQLPPGKFSKN